MPGGSGSHSIAILGFFWANGLVQAGGYCFKCEKLIHQSGAVWNLSVHHSDQDSYSCKQQKPSSTNLREERELICSSEPRLSSGMWASRAQRVLSELSLSATLLQCFPFSSSFVCFVLRRVGERLMYSQSLSVMTAWPPQPQAYILPASSPAESERSLLPELGLPGSDWPSVDRVSAPEAGPVLARFSADLPGLGNTSLKSGVHSTPPDAEDREWLRVVPQEKLSAFPSKRGEK